jgi:hypothetical protein
MHPPQPASEPYEVGAKVTIYISDTDVDAEHHNTDCIVTERFTDELHLETGRDTDQYSYQLKRLSNGEELPVQFRHSDLVPHSTEG